MRLNIRAAAAIAAVAVVSGCGVTHHDAAPAAHSAELLSSMHSATAARQSRPVDPSLAWLESPGGQAQVTLNDDIDTLAMDLEVENNSPTVANHLAFEADARVVRAEARKILATPSLLPAVHRAAYQRMLKDFITVANLLQPGPGYGTTAQDYTAWYKAMRASDITVS